GAGAGAGGGGAGAGAAGGRPAATATGAAAPADAFTGNPCLHPPQRARTPPAGTLAGSTRYTVSHDGQVTFIERRPCRRHPAPGRGGGRPRTRTPAAFSRSSSSRSPAR